MEKNTLNRECLFQKNKDIEEKIADLIKFSKLTINLIN
jgi:hypothetical protein